MENIISIKSTWKIALLEKQIKNLDSSQDVARQAVFQRALKAAQGIKDWERIQRSLLTLKKEEDSHPFTPVSFQLRYSDDTAPILKQIQADIMEQLTLDRLKANFFLQLLEQNYVNLLNDVKRKEETKIALLSTKGAEKNTEIDSLSILRLLIEMIQRTPECAELEQISRLIIRWREHYIK